LSSINIAGDTSGTVTLDAPAVAGSTVLTLPARSGTVMVNGPAFSASKTTSQTIGSNTQTKVQYNNEQWDTNNNYDNTTNYRFTPTVAGYYQINAAIFYGSNSTICFLVIFKNGSAFKRGAQLESNNYGVSVSGQVYLNGSTDYVEIYVFTQGGSTLDSGAPNYFDGVLVRAA
jgi:hypothetical protein